MHSSYHPDEVFAICYPDSLLFSISERNSLLSLVIIGLVPCRKKKNEISDPSLFSAVLGAQAQRAQEEPKDLFQPFVTQPVHLNTCLNEPRKMFKEVKYITT